MEVMELLEKALRGYLKSNGRRLLALMDVAGQSEVCIECSALYRYFEGGEKYPRLIDALEDLFKEEAELRKRGIKLVRKGDFLGFKVSREYVARVLRGFEGREC